MSGLRDLQAEFPQLGDVRGLGLMVGVEVGANGRAPDAALAKAIQQGAMARNMLLLTCGAHANTIRWIPPLVATEAQIADGLHLFSESVAAAVGLANGR
mgnify:FL=1